jgi:hypothetical protein
VQVEGAAVLPVLQALPQSAFDTPTLLPGWSVRDVVAHCSAVLAMAITGRFQAVCRPRSRTDPVHLVGAAPRDYLMVS